jgi:hypothetical protein
VREGDKARHVSKQRALVKTLMARTLKGDSRSAGLLLSMMMRLLDTGEGADSHDEPLHEDEREVLRDFEARLRRDEAKTGDASEKPKAPRRATRRGRGTDS